MKSINLFLSICALFFTSCDNELTDSDLYGGGNDLSISVLTHTESKGVLSSTYLPSESQIGVCVTNTSGGNYDGHSYNNILFTANGSDASQIWTPSSAIQLSMNEGSCSAYYPYSSSVNDITKVPVSTSGQLDYLYATPVLVNAENKTATLSMKHALSVVRFAVKKGTYYGSGKLTSVSVKSSALGTTATLNAKTGALSNVAGKNSAISVSKSITLNSAVQYINVIVIPTESTADLMLSVKIDGVSYSKVISNSLVAKANCNTYTLTVNKGELALSGMKIGNWSYNDSGSLVISANGNTITFDGDYDKIALNNRIVGDTVIIKALSVLDDCLPVPITTSSGTIMQRYEGNMLSISLFDIDTDLQLTFKGVLSPPEAIAEDFSQLHQTGVFAIRHDMKPALSSEANETCIGVCLYFNLIYSGGCLMIEKYEHANLSYKVATLNKYSNNSFCWGGYGTDQEDIPSYPEVEGATHDWFGQSNTETLKTIMSGGEGDNENKYPTIGCLVNEFIKSDYFENLGFDDWYVPAAAQLQRIAADVSTINETLSAMGGTPLSTSTMYWSSSEYDSQNGWSIYTMYNGAYSSRSKSAPASLRLVRSLD